MYDEEFFTSLLNDTFEERKCYLETNCSILDIEIIACDLYYHVTKNLYKNLSGDIGIGCCVKEKELLEEILAVRCCKLDSNFEWTDVYKNQLIELNNKIMNGFLKAYEEAKVQFNILKERMNSNDQFINGFNIDIYIKPFILEPNGEEYFLEESGKGIYYLLYNIMPDTLWAWDVYYEKKLEKETDSIYMDDKENHNINEYLGEKTFQDEYICWGMYELFSHTKHFMSWYDILKINQIWVEVKINNQHFIEDIGKGGFWEDNLQSLADNEAENLRQEFMSCISKNMTGLSVDLYIDEMNCWKKIGPYERIKLQGDTSKFFNHKKIFSISLDKNPRILVKDAQIDLTDKELQRVKDFIVKNIKFLLNIVKGKVTVLDLAEKLKKL